MHSFKDQFGNTGLGGNYRLSLRGQEPQMVFDIPTQWQRKLMKRIEQAYVIAALSCGHKLEGSKGQNQTTIVGGNKVLF